MTKSIIIKSLIPRVLIALTFVVLIISSLGTEPALAFHLQAEANAIRETKQTVQSIDNQLNQTRQALLNANLTNAFFYLSLAQRQLSTLETGNGTIGMYAILPRPSPLPSSVTGGQSTFSPPPSIPSSSPSFSSSPSIPSSSPSFSSSPSISSSSPSISSSSPSISSSSPSISSSSPSISSSSQLPQTTTTPGQTTTIPGQPTQSTTIIPGQAIISSRPTQAGQPIQPGQIPPTQAGQPIQPGQIPPTQAGQPTTSPLTQAQQQSRPSIPSQSTIPSIPSQPSQPSIPAQPTRPTQPTQPTLPAQPFLPTR
jgi:hypothetical protein